MHVEFCTEWRWVHMMTMVMNQKRILGDILEEINGYAFIGFDAATES
jgi:hypothetical protein